MPQYVTAPPGSEAFREQFGVIREEFISRVMQLAKVEGVGHFRVCDVDGEPIDWIWNNDSFRYVGQVGNAADARGYLEAMFNQGMRVACLVTDSADCAEMWLTAWEAPMDEPHWPLGISGRIELIHDGVRQASQMD
jgi:hypothetical protein